MTTKSKSGRTAALVGLAGLAGLAVFLVGRKAKAENKAGKKDGPTPEPDEPDEPGEPPTEPPKPAAVKKNAPPFSSKGLQETTTAFLYLGQFRAAVGRAAAKLGYIEHPEEIDVAFANDPGLREESRREYGIPRGRTIASYLTDETFFDLYPGVGKIPAKKNRGTGWQPYIDSWKRIWEYNKDMLGDVD